MSEKWDTALSSSCIASDGVAPLFGVLYCSDAKTKCSNQLLTSNIPSDSILDVSIRMEVQNISPPGCEGVRNETLLSLPLVLLATVQRLYLVYFVALVLKISSGINSLGQILLLKVFRMFQYNWKFKIYHRLVVKELEVRHWSLFLLYF